MHLPAHNGGSSAAVAALLLDRALKASITAPPVFCTSLVTWGKSIGLTLHQAAPAPLPPTLNRFLAAAQDPLPRPIYTDGSFTVDSPLMAALTQSPIEQAMKHAVAATGVYLPPAYGLPALALRIVTPTGGAPDAYN